MKKSMILMSVACCLALVGCAKGCDNKTVPATDVKPPVEVPVEVKPAPAPTTDVKPVEVKPTEPATDVKPVPAKEK